MVTFSWKLNSFYVVVQVEWFILSVESMLRDFIKLSHGAQDALFLAV